MPHIDSPQNPLIKSTARLRTRRGRQTQGKIIIDGWREVTRAAHGGVSLTQVFLPADLDVQPHQTWLDSVAANGTELFRVSPRAFEKIAFGNRQEAVAVAETPHRPLASLSLPDEPVLAVLAELEKPGNIGAILRSCDAAGVDGVIVVAPATDLFNPNTIRASLGTLFTQPVAECSLDEYQRWLKDSPVGGALPHYLARLDDRARVHTDVDYRKGCALVLGSEAEGLDEAWARLPAAESICIPMRGVADSLNVSAAAAVLLYEATRNRSR